MPSPFPGMDPYLEHPALWPDFHRRLVNCLSEILQPGLPHRVATGERRYKVDNLDHEEAFLEVRQCDENRLLTLLEVVSPANKTTEPGRQAYLDQRRLARDAGANTVEIDLVLQGRPTLDYSRDGLPEWRYAVTVTRSTHTERYEIYTATLQKRLPRFRLPLAADERDTVLDLQAAFTRCYDNGGFRERIDYRADPLVALSEEERSWFDTMLQSKGLRQPPPSHAEIADAAYRLWEHAGRVHGHDREHWFRALAIAPEVTRATNQPGRALA